MLGKDTSGTSFSIQNDLVPQIQYAIARCRAVLHLLYSYAKWIDNIEKFKHIVVLYFDLKSPLATVSVDIWCKNVSKLMQQ